MSFVPANYKPCHRCSNFYVAMRKVACLLAIVSSLFLINAAPVLAEEREYLNTSEDMAIFGGSLAVGIVGELVVKTDPNRAIQLGGPLPGENAIQHFLGGGYHTDKSNFLDNSFGSALTPSVYGVALLLADVTWPQGKPYKDAGEDLLLYGSGLAVTKGVTGIFKGLFSRSRPMVGLEPEVAAARERIDLRYDQTSFFSGHTSSSFFAATYLNKRLRTIMRQRLSGDEYRDWRWTPPAILFSWASFVGWSRIHAYKHYLSDVVVGALAGYLLAELFYSFGQDVISDGGTTGKLQPIFSLHFSF